MRFSPTDMQSANKRIGMTCGHGAFAAVTEQQVNFVERCFPALKQGKTWVNMPDMEHALRLAEIRFTVVGRKLPDFGLAILQWEGSWTAPGVPPQVACKYRHWIAVDGVMIWDANLEEWVPKLAWENEFIPELLPPKSTGWSVARGYQIIL